MTSRSVLPALLALAASACATAAPPGKPLTGIIAGPYYALSAVASFDHGCPKERIRMIRDLGGTVADLDVCGDVRRYKAVAGYDPGSSGTVAWLDVTSAYPRNVLPQPLPPER